MGFAAVDVEQLLLGAVGPQGEAQEAAVGDGPLPFARLDHHRALRQGRPEVVFAEGKSVDQVLAIMTAERCRVGRQPVRL